MLCPEKIEVIEMENTPKKQITRKLCWWITEKCNENCVYCFRSLSSINRFTLEEHMEILKGIIAFGTEQITWSGGEALLVPHATELIKYAKEHGIYNKITTNGKLLTPEKIEELKPYVDLVALSIDSLDDATNKALGRGVEHRSTVINRIRHLMQEGIQVDINTVVMRTNIQDLDEMGSFFRENPISGKWKLMTFFPVRERALANKEKLEIDDAVFLAEAHRLIEKYRDVNIMYMMNDQIQQQYPGVRANGDLLVTRQFQDMILGNMMDGNVRNPFLF
jgi:radical S-adenosyl methionine domain-containing protein 2